MTIVTSSPLLAPFNPRQLGNILTGWWDGNNPNGNGILPSNGAPISSFVDLSGYGNVFSQATGGSQPVFSASAKNGRNAILLTNSHFMTTINPPNGFTFGSNPRSLILVFSLTNTIIGNNHIIW